MRKRTSTLVAPDANLPDVEMPVPGDASRRDFLKMGAGLVAGAAALPRLTFAADDGEDDDETLERLKRGKRDPRRRLLLKGGTIISMDPQVGNFVKGDVLIGTVRNVGYRFVPRKAPGTESETQLRETGTARADR